MMMDGGAQVEFGVLTIAIGPMDAVAYVVGIPPSGGGEQGADVV